MAFDLWTAIEEVLVPGYARALIHTAGKGWSGRWWGKVYCSEDGSVCSTASHAALIALLCSVTAKLVANVASIADVACSMHSAAVAASIGISCIDGP